MPPKQTKHNVKQQSKQKRARSPEQPRPTLPNLPISFQSLSGKHEFDYDQITPSINTHRYRYNVPASSTIRQSIQDSILSKPPFIEIEKQRHYYVEHPRPPGFEYYQLHYYHFLLLF